MKVTETGGFATAGTRQVTLPAHASAMFLLVATVEDTLAEPDGSVTATLAGGTGYRVLSSQGAATVAVAETSRAGTRRRPAARLRPARRICRRTR